MRGSFETGLNRIQNRPRLREISSVGTAKAAMQNMIDSTANVLAVSVN
jgi:hypothetical protein